MVQAFKTSATVTAIAQAKRQATRLGPDGKKFSVKAGSEAVNSDQIRVGDQVNTTVEEKPVAYLDKKGPMVSAVFCTLAGKGRLVL
jgi:hypothetical protein